MNTYFVSLKAIGGNNEGKGGNHGSCSGKHDEDTEAVWVEEWEQRARKNKKKDNDGDHYEKHSECPHRLRLS